MKLENIHSISKQSSRKLYSHELKKYISMEILYDEVVKSDYNFQILNNHTKENITLDILNQALLRSLKGKIQRGELNTNIKTVQKAMRYLHDQYDGNIYSLILEHIGVRQMLSQ